jgi:hypothetical protein
MKTRTREEIQDEIDDINNQVQDLEDEERYCVTQFEESLDECCDMVRIGSLEYLPSQVLRVVDPVAYREEYNNWVNFRMSDLEDERNDLEAELEQAPEEEE